MKLMFAAGSVRPFVALLLAALLFVTAVAGGGNFLAAIVLALTVLVAPQTAALARAIDSSRQLAAGSSHSSSPRAPPLA